jgi:type VI secretion system protein ImpK
MTTTGSPDTPVLSAFRTFCAELSGLRDSVRSEPSVPWEDAEASAGFPARRFRVSQIQDTLTTTLQRLELETRLSHGERAAQQVHEASYFMAALADEWFVSLDWDGRELWIATPLEERLHGTQNAGESVFQRAETLLQQDGDRELATVVLLTLALGFQGQYRGRGDLGNRALRDIQDRLLGFVSKGARILSEQGSLFPQASRHTLTQAPQARLPRLATWTFIAAFAVLGYLALSHLTWNNLSGGVRDVVERIDWTGVTIGGGAP